MNTKHTQDREKKKIQKRTPVVISGEIEYTI